MIDFVFSSWFYVGAILFVMYIVIIKNNEKKITLRDLGAAVTYGVLSYVAIAGYVLLLLILLLDNINWDRKIF